MTLKHRWTFQARHGLYQRHGKVQLVGDRAYGQWLCVELGSGTCVWERQLGRPNTVVGFAKNTIVATEMRSDGPWTMRFGVYGIDAQTGNVTWTSHEDGVLGGLCSLLDHVPGISNEFRDTPSHLEGERVYCASGRVLDAETGRCIETVDTARPQLAHSIVVLSKSVKTEWGELTIQTPTPERPQRFAATLEHEGRMLWRFDAEQHGLRVKGDTHAWRVLTDRVLLLVAHTDDPAGDAAKEAAAQHRLICLDLRDGSIAQALFLSETPGEECRLEECSDQVVLVSSENRTLACFEVQPFEQVPQPA